MKNIILPVVAFFLFSQPIFSQKTVTTLQVPGTAEFCKIDPVSMNPDANAWLKFSSNLNWYIRRPF